MSNTSLQAPEPSHWDSIEALRDLESDATWDHVFALRKIASPTVLEHSLQWCGDTDPFRRSIGVSVLAQLGEDGRLYEHEAATRIRTMVATESDHEVITSLISAVYFRGLNDCVPWLMELARHAEEDIRWRVAWALPLSAPRPDAMEDAVFETLRSLSRDPESRVRDWATFSLAQSGEDSPRVREALLERTDDVDFDTRCEAMVGLAMRRDPRGVEPLCVQLASDRVGELMVEAAEHYADSRLRPALVRLRKWWDVNPDLLERAIAACT
jgi:HEAT repeat protein